MPEPWYQHTARELLHGALQRRHEMLIGGPVHQAEAIANHYAANASEAMMLRRLIELYRECPTETIAGFIADTARRIKIRHLRDLGLVIAWDEESAADVASLEGSHMLRNTGWCCNHPKEVR